MLWEITGNGLKKPSYLMGTMHVSNKIAFHLSDSFFYALRSVEMVALENHLETLQEDLSRYDFTRNSYYPYNYDPDNSIPDEYMSIRTFRFSKYYPLIKAALNSNPSVINNLLYRSYGEESSDFEEDTYLDLYIFQCGKKLGKRTAGLENFDENMRLVQEAYLDEAKDKNKKERSFDDWNEAYSLEKLQEAYRRGNLDLLDSISRYNSVSEAFDEKFIYQRNIIQAKSIDSILKTGTTLFAGVGAAHLPGERGVIEILRKKGYKLRPVKMGERDSRERERLDKIRVPVTFHTYTSEDGAFSVDVPGKLYELKEEPGLNQKHFADMSNGSYYLITRFATNAWMWNQNPDDVLRVVDSLLYENVPGKIIEKKNILRNGYKGLDFTNRTRRGDLQRYHVFVTPFEIILFKISGNGDYIKGGPEAEQFFGSIRFREYKFSETQTLSAWKTYKSPFAGFSVQFPHEPFIGKDEKSFLFEAFDPAGGTCFAVVKRDIHNFYFVEEDTFDLALMEESFLSSEFVDTPLSRQYLNYKGYPALEAKYRDKYGNTYAVRYMIRGPHYYMQITRYKTEGSAVRHFYQSWEWQDFVYNKPETWRDTLLKYTVHTPYYPKNEKKKFIIPGTGYDDDDEDDVEEEFKHGFMNKNRIITNDSTGEKIFVSFYKPARYFYFRDSAKFQEYVRPGFFFDSTYILHSTKEFKYSDGARSWEVNITDTGSSRMLRTKTWYKDGLFYILSALSDTLSKPGLFIKNFFESFTPDDTLKGINAFAKKTEAYFKDFFSGDTLVHKSAIRYLPRLQVAPSDFPFIRQAIERLNWKQKNYLSVKELLIQKLAEINSKESADYLKQLYHRLEDTIQLQYAALESLLRHKTAYAYSHFRDIIKSEPPVLETEFSRSQHYRRTSRRNAESSFDGNFMDELFDSLRLTQSIFPDLLPLIELEDYEPYIKKLLVRLIDSNLIQPKEYEAYVRKFYIKAKQELKKQSIREKRKAIEKAEESKKTNKTSSYDGQRDEDEGNQELILYARLLLPFTEKHQGAAALIQRLLSSGDKRLRYNTFYHLLKKNKPFPDSLLRYFASLDEYRFELYSDLKEYNKLHLFPCSYNSHVDLARSELIYLASSYERPDTLIYLKAVPVSYLGYKGFIHFFKYKRKKDDIHWKLALAGMTPENPALYEFDKDAQKRRAPGAFRPSSDEEDKLKFTRLTPFRIPENEPLEKWLQRVIRREFFSRRQSAYYFYERESMEQQEDEEDE
ncbi:MAG: TraB/GumN family protein [Chitinophagaceae bacterium]|nr:TraB/GumN family protein [Chitinophagaceae bacterium]